MVIDSHLAADTQTIDPSAMSCRSSGLGGDERDRAQKDNTTDRQTRSVKDKHEERDRDRQAEAERVTDKK